MELPEEILLQKAAVEAALSIHSENIPQFYQALESALNSNPNDLTALYCVHLLAFREQKFDKAYDYFRRALNAWYFHPAYLNSLLTHFTWSDAQRFVLEYIRRYPDDPCGYILKLSICRIGGRMNVYRECMTQCYEKSGKGVHFQPSVIASVFDAAKEMSFTAVWEPGLEEMVRKNVFASQPDGDVVPQRFVQVWRPLAIAETSVELAVVVRGGGDIALEFCLCPVRGKADEVKSVSVLEERAEGDIRHYRSIIQSLLPNTEYKFIVAINGEEFGAAEFRTLGNEDLQVETISPEPMGLDGANLNGVISHTGLPTKYYFRYGRTPDELTETTVVRSLPPGRYGRVRDSADNIFHRINSFSSSISFKKFQDDADEVESERSQTPSIVTMMLETPFGRDRNHLDGIGAIDLLLGWQSAAHVRGNVPPSFESASYPKPEYPGESIDLRDAVFTVRYRAKGFDAKAFHLVAWVHSSTGEKALISNDLNYTPWALTKNIESQRIIDDGKWNEISFTFNGNSNAWSFCGSNIEEQGPMAAKYCYFPIGKTLQENRSGNICLAFVCGDEMAPPEGDIELGSLELCYRSKSLLAPGQLGGLVSWPSGSEFDPGSLTGGGVGNIEDCWRSMRFPQENQEFVWQFQDEVLISSAKLHQNPIWPSSEVEIEVSPDGTEFESVWKGQLMDVPNDPANWTGGFDIPTPFNFCNVVVFDEPVKGMFLRLKIKSGYRSEFWGLDAVEIFGDESVLRPSPEPCTFSEDIDGLKDEPVFVQLVAENAAGKVEGEIVELSRPVNLRPQVEGARVTERSETSATVRLRTNAMGSWATVQILLKDADGGSVLSASVPIGKQQVARNAVIRIEGLRPRVSYSGEAIAKNNHGESDNYPLTIGV